MKLIVSTEKERGNEKEYGKNYILVFHCGEYSKEENLN